MNTLTEIANHFGVELVRQYPGTVSSMEKFIEGARNEQDIEGYVIRFDDGHMLKIKADLYVILHKTVSKIQQEKDVWNLILDDKADDLKPLLPEDKREKLDEFQVELINAVRSLSETFQVEFDKAMFELNSRDFSVFENAESERKRMFAIEFVNSNEALPEGMRNLMFTLYNGEDAFDTVRGFFLSNTSTGTKVDRVRKYVGDLRWSVVSDDEEDV